MKKKKILIVCGIVIFILILAVLAIINKIVRIRNNDLLTKYDDISTLVQSLGCEFIKSQGSSEKDFDKDIYIVFGENTSDKNGYSNQKYYENIVETIDKYLENINIRIIDETRNLTIRVKYDKETKSYIYTFNNEAEDRYFSKQESLNSIQNSAVELNDEYITVKSLLLRNLIQEDWKTERIDLGKKESIVDNYDIYFDEGYKIRKITNRVYNVIFTRNYKDEVFQGIRTGMTNDEVRNILKDPQFDNDYQVDCIGYKIDDLYAFFSDGNISVYRVDSFDENSNKEFAQIFTELCSNGDYNSFINKLTDLYPEYDYYIQKEDRIELSYPLLGFKFTLGNDGNNGLILYSNYKGMITNNYRIDDILNDGKVPTNVSLKLNENLIYISDANRAVKENMIRTNYDDICNISTSLYNVKLEKDKIKFYSIDEKSFDYEIDVAGVNSIFKVNDGIFVYGISGDGIYACNPENKQTAKLISGTEKYEIKKVENMVIYYDETSVKLDM